MLNRYLMKSKAQGTGNTTSRRVSTRTSPNGGAAGVPRNGGARTPGSGARTVSARNGALRAGQNRISRPNRGN